MDVLNSLTKLEIIHAYPFLCVSRGGDVYNRNSRKFMKPRCAPGKSPKVITTFEEKTLRVRQAFLVAACYVPLPEGFELPRDFDRLDLDYVDGNYMNVRWDNLKWVVKPDINFLLSEAAGEERIFPLPSFLNIAASRSGKVFNLYTKQEIKPVPFSNGYLRVEPRIGRERYCLLHHRIIAELFVEPKEGFTIKECVEQLVVNHKNSKRDDNRPENLEWVTSSENTHHGYDMDNMKVNVKVELRNFATGDVRRIRSLRDLIDIVQVPQRVLFEIYQKGLLHRVLFLRYTAVAEESGKEHLTKFEFASKDNPFYHLYKNGKLTLSAQKDVIEAILPGVASYINEDGTIADKPKSPYRVSSWTITRR